MFKKVILITIALIVLVGCSEGHRNTSSLNTDGATKSTSAFIDQNGYNHRPFSIKSNGWIDNHQLDLVLNWRGDGGSGSGAVDLKVEEQDIIAIDDNIGKSVEDYPAMKVNDLNYNGVIDIADQIDYERAKGETFKGFYLYWNSGNPGSYLSLLDINGNPNPNMKYDDPYTPDIDESVVGYQFNKSSLLTLSTTRNTEGFLECSFHPMFYDGLGRYFPLLKNKDYFILVPFGYSNKTNSDDELILDQYSMYQVNIYNPTDLNLTFDRVGKKLYLTWFDNDNIDHWIVTLTCNYGYFPDNLKQTISFDYLLDRNVEVDWDGNPSGTKPITFTAEVRDSSRLAETAQLYTYVTDVAGGINSQVNKLWLTYKCVNNPPQRGDYVYVYGYLMNNYYTMNGNSFYSLWTTYNSLELANNDYPLSYFNIGGRGIYTNKDSVDLSGTPPSGAVLTPSNRYSMDNREYHEYNGTDSDTGIFSYPYLWTFNTATARRSWLNSKHYEKTTLFRSIVPVSGKNVSDYSECLIGSHINLGNPVTTYKSGTLENNINTNVPVNQSGYWLNTVFKVTAIKGTTVKIGVIPIRLPNSLDKSEAYIETGYSSNDKIDTNCFQSKAAVMVVPINDIVFTVGG